MAARGLVSFLGALPESAALALGSGLGGLARRLDRKHRTLAGENLAAAFPEMREGERLPIVAGMYRNFGLTLAEWAQARNWSEQDYANRISFEGLEHVEAARAAGRGAVMLVGHLGNWELTGAAFAHRFPGQVTVAAQEQNNRIFDRYINGLREKAGMKVVLSHSGAFEELLKDLRSNRFLGLLADQHAGPGGEILPFFGRNCSVLRSPALLAKRARSRLLPAVLRRGEPGRFKFRVLPAVDLSGSLAEATARWLSVFEGLVREKPEDWFWVHRRWKV